MTATGSATARPWWRWKRVALLGVAIVLGAAVASPPVRYRYHLWRAYWAEEAGALEVALRQADAAAALAADDPASALLLARIERQRERFGQAYYHLSRARQRAAPADRIQREQILLEAQRGNVVAVEGYVPQLFAAPREEARESCEAFVRGAIRSLDFDRAERYLQGWLDDFPRDAVARQLLGRARWGQAREDEASAAYQAAIDLAPRDLEGRLEFGRFLMAYGRADEAAEQFRAATDIAPDNVPALLGLAEALLETGDVAGAKRRLDDVGKRPDLERDLEARQHALRGQVALGESDYERAAIAYQQACDLRPFDLEVRYALAQALQASGAPDDAAEHLAYVEKVGPLLDEAKAEMEQAFRAPENLPLRVRIARKLTDFGDPNDAVFWWLSVLRLDPNHAEAQQRLRGLTQQGPVAPAEPDPDG